MPLLGVLITMFVGLIIIGMFFYIMVIGRVGLQFFKYNFPLTKRRGTFYLIRLRNGRFKWVYDRFKTVWNWSDGTKSYIGKKFDTLAQTTEPLIFLVEGYPTNPMLADLLTKEEMSKLVNNIIKTQETTARLEQDLDKEKPPMMDKLLPVLTLVFAAVGALVGLAMFMNLGDIVENLETLTKFVGEIKPHIPKLVEAIEKLPRQI